MQPITALALDDREALCEWIGDRPETVLSVGALRSGYGRAAFVGDPRRPAAALVESGLVPAEPQGLGDADALLELLGDAHSWGCVETDIGLSREIVDEFDRRWGLANTVVDVVHALRAPATTASHPLVRRLTPDAARRLAVGSPDLLPARAVVLAAAEMGRVFAAVDREVIVGHGSSLAASRLFADVGVHVVERARGHGIATAAASLACQAVQRAGLTPVWGTGSENAASLRVAHKVGFTEVARLVFLVRER